ncbi:MAG: hypothetical protein ABSB74_09965 [Tepidisphaeraceae bacterium]
MADVTPVPVDPGISEASKTDLNLASNPAEIAEIRQKVHDEVAKLAQNPSDPAIVSMVRQWLVDEMQSKDAPGATSPAYEKAYASELNAAFVDILVPSTPVNTRLNIGIVIKSLPGRTEMLARSVVQLLKDKSPAVVLWGEKAAGAILPAGVQDPAFNAGPRDEILAAIIDSVAAQPAGPIAGMIAEEANQAINPKLNTNTWPANLFPTPAVLSVLIDANLKLQKARLEIYKNSGVPGWPLADTYASYLTLGIPDVWNAMTPAQQLQAAQQASDFISLASQRAATRPNNENDELIGALDEEGRWIQELGKTLNDDDLQAAGIGVNKLEVASPLNQVRDACSAVFPAFQRDQNFSTLQPPPTLANPKSASDSSGSAATTEAQR